MSFLELKKLQKMHPFLAFSILIIIPTLGAIGLISAFVEFVEKGGFFTIMLSLSIFIAVLFLYVYENS